MSRIFDALKKAQTPLTSMLSPAVVPPPAMSPVLSASVPPASPASRPIAHAPLTALPRIEIVRGGTLPEQAAQELSTLRVGLESAFESLPTRVIMLMSSQAGEGTSTVAWRFASLLAQPLGRQVLLVDLHARRPSLSRRFEAGEFERGTGPELSLLPMPSEARERGVLAPGATRALLEALAGSYEWVVLDGPPVLESPDAVELAALADGVALVVQAGSAKRPVVTRAADLLRKGGGRVLGSVLNRRRLEIPEFIYRRI